MDQRLSPDERLHQLEALHREVHEFALSKDPEVVHRRLPPSVHGFDVVLVGQALGRDTQRRSGLPYTFPDGTLSRAGNVLDAFLCRFNHTIDASVHGHGRRYTYHTDLVPWFPGRSADGRGDVVPSKEDIERCWGWLANELTITAPPVVVALGLHSAAQLLARFGETRASRAKPQLKELVMRVHEVRIADRGTKLLVVHHPSGAFQFRESPRVYEWTAAAIRSILAGVDVEELTSETISPPARATSRLTGRERVHSRGDRLSGTVLDFWQWSASDLLSNATRGRLAEYLVHLALSGRTDSVRNEWDAFDLTTPNGIKVEVKSAAYVQSWAQRGASVISFGIAPTRAWSADTGLYDDEIRRQADVYVFALLHHQDRASIDPLDVRQWSFHVVPTPALNERVVTQRTIGLSAVLTLSGGAVAFEELAEAIRRSATPDSEQQPDDPETG